MNPIEQMLLDELRGIRTELQETRTEVLQRLTALEERAPTKGRQLARDGGLTISGGALGAIVAAVAQALLAR
jgi:hypothetical protein